MSWTIFEMGTYKRVLEIKTINAWTNLIGDLIAYSKISFSLWTAGSIFYSYFTSI